MSARRFVSIPLNQPCQALAVSRRGDMIAAYKNFGGLISVYDVSGKLLAAVERTGPDVSKEIYFTDNDLVISDPRDPYRETCSFQAIDMKRSGEVSFSAALSERPRFKWQAGQIALSETGRHILTNPNTGTAEDITLYDSHAIETCRFPNRVIKVLARAIAIHEGTDRIALATSREGINLLSISTGEIVRTLEGLFGDFIPAERMAFSSCGRFLAVSRTISSSVLQRAYVGGLRIYDAASGALLHESDTHGECPDRLEWWEHMRSFNAQVNDDYIIIRERNGQFTASTRTIPGLIDAVAIPGTSTIAYMRCGLLRSSKIEFLDLGA
ncbi:hypothetical protein GS501_04430 [Saccharibacter sp. 17.LH.SD]|uniref:hypothetical protein n=1 Tax=Saccharibacter sp. 17.LH.SD TaxID=2689393 RepID=UPI00136B09D6|nr:hypothetical protein [Saccharibacter sp. 17.LH.SD]MXV44294.1 hypothetical protein [Saccharibacter sp. 17.LH.SD]